MAVVLIVDDRKPNREFVQAALEPRNHTVIEARDGEEGLRLAEKFKPDLIITDILMPRVDGFEFLQSLRRNPALERTPVIVYSQSHVEEPAQALLDRCGVFRVVLRSANVDDLLSVTDQALASGGVGPSLRGDEEFESEHRRILTDKLAQQVAALEEEVARRRESDARLMAALGASGVRIADWDLEKDWITITGCEVDSAEPKIVVGNYLTITSPIHPEDYPRFLEALEAGKRDRGEVRIQYRQLSETSTSVIELRGRFQFDENGRAIRMLCGLLDVTQHVAHQKEKLFLASLVEHSLDFIGASDTEGVVTFVNDAGKRLMGLEPSAAVSGESILTHVYPEDYPKVVDVALPAQHQKGEWRGELRLLNRTNGEPIPCECLSFMIFNPQGDGAGFGMIARDIRDRKIAERELNLRLKQLTTLRRIDIAISGSFDIQLVLQLLASELKAQEGVLSAWILRLDPHLKLLEYAAGVGGDPASEGLELAELAVRDRRSVRGTVANEQILVAFPLIAKGIVRGVLAITHSNSFPIEGSPEQFVHAIAGLAAIALDNGTMFEDLQRSKDELATAYDATLEGWAKVIDLRDCEPEGHTSRVTEMTLRIAREMHVSPDTLTHIRRGALLHDIGKLGLPDAILQRHGALSAEERTALRRHPIIGAELLESIPFLHPAIDIPFCHHERWDGGGYPQGLRGAQIPLAARIFAVADTWDALTSEQVDRLPKSKPEAIELIKAESGKQFDPNVIAAFLKLYSNG